MEKIPSKASKNLAAARREQLLNELKALGNKTYEDLEQSKFPEFLFPSRSVSNIVYDPKLKQYILDKVNVKRSAGNIKHIRPFTQMLWLAYFADRLVRQGKTSTLRDAYYSSQADAMEFVDQAESDEIITDLETVLSRAREEFKIYPEERSAIFGDLTIEYTVPRFEGRRLNLSSHPDGYLIGPSLSTAEFVDTSAEMIIAVEKGGIFTQVCGRGGREKIQGNLDRHFGSGAPIHEVHAQALEQRAEPPGFRNDRWRRLRGAHRDGDHFRICQCGASARFDRSYRKVDRSLGLGHCKVQTPTDPMTETDIKRAQELKKDPRYHGGVWQRELDIFLKIKRKSELEAFSKFGLTFIVDRYLKEKMDEATTL